MENEPKSVTLTKAQAEELKAKHAEELQAQHQEKVPEVVEVEPNACAVDGTLRVDGSLPCPAVIPQTVQSPAVKVDKRKKSGSAAYRSERLRQVPAGWKEVAHGGSKWWVPEATTHLAVHTIDVVVDGEMTQQEMLWGHDSAAAAKANGMRVVAVLR